MIKLQSYRCSIIMGNSQHEMCLYFSVKTVHAYPPNFEVSCPTFEFRMRRFGNSSQRFVPNVSTFRQNVRANLTNFIQDLFWRVTFSNEDFKMVEDGLQLGDRQDLKLSVPGSTCYSECWCEEESKKIYFCIKSKRIKGKR